MAGILEMLTEEEAYLLAILTDESGLDQAEFLWHAADHEYGCFRAWPFQHAWWRNKGSLQIDQCSRSAGKSLSIQVKTCAFPLLHPAHEMVITAPEGNHLQAVTDLIETRLKSNRFYSELLLANASQGVTHRPFLAKFRNGSRIMGRIPQRDGRGVKGVHPLWLEMDEAQDYPSAGWTEIVETLKQGHESARWRAHGVTKGIRDEFWKFTQPDSDWFVHRYAAMWRPTWTTQERDEKIKMYGSSNHPDYRRNVLGKHGDVANPLFVLTRLMRCVDLDPASDYNQEGYQKISINAEMVEDRGGEILNAIDIPMTHKRFKTTWGGADIGFTVDPTEILIFQEDEKNKAGEPVMKLMSRFRLERISAPDQMKVILFLIDFYNLNAFSMDKMQPVSEPVLTPEGWTPIGEISVGDGVIGANGLPTKVTGVYPQRDKSVKEVHFSDGASTRCGPEHLWTAVVKKNGKVFPGRDTFTTDQLEFLKSEGWSVRIPTVEPVARPEAELPLDPYVLGAFLGDGNIRKNSVRFSSVDDQIIQRVMGSLPFGHSLIDLGRCDWGVKGPGAVRTADGRFSHSNEIMAALRALGLAGLRSEEKFIPGSYLSSSVSQRIDLLRGLMDTDGYSESNGHVGFCSSSEALIDGVRDLVWSLGGTATKRRNEVWVKGVRYKDQFKSAINLPAHINPFFLERKAKNVKARPPLRWVTNICQSEQEESVCIRVEAEDHLYVTRDYVVTHNTGNGLPLFQMIQEQAGQDGMVPQKILERIKGYNFSEKIPVDFDQSIDVEEFGGDEVQDTQIKRNVLEYSSDKLREYIDTQRLHLPDDRDLITEFQGQTYTYDKGGMDMYGRKRFSKGSFHALDAARMAVLGQVQYGIEAMLREHNRVKKPDPVYDIFVPY